MTRKCVICKNKNYKNSCSFFSAPKDAKIRCLWQKAINIKDYIVNDDTYVCSKHFCKDDIITHWVSGIPPKVITIKYKKCRLREGAVPIQTTTANYALNKVSLNIGNKSNILDSKTYFTPCKKRVKVLKEIYRSKRSENSSCKLEDEIYKYIPDGSKTKTILEKQRSCNSNILNRKQDLYSMNHSDILYIDGTYVSNNEAQQRKNDIQVHSNKIENVSKYYSKKNYNEIKYSSKSLQASDNEANNKINSLIDWTTNSVDRKLEINFGFNKEHFRNINNPLQKGNSCQNSSMLFEDFLEIYNKVLLPTNWFASMVTKGNAITVVYSSMKILNSGMPCVEKKVFLNNEMILRCSIFNKELNPRIFLKNKESNNVNTLLDIKDFIDKFDKTSIYTGEY